MDHCEECGFSYDLGTEAPLGALLRSAVAPIVAALEADAVGLRVRPPGAWSAVEYACHVRDVLLVQRERVFRALFEDVPRFPPMYREERAALERRDDPDPHAVAAQLTAATEMLVHTLAALHDDELERTGLYNYPEPTERSVRWIGIHTLHEARHHALDVQRLLAAASR